MILDPKQQRILIQQRLRTPAPTDIPPYAPSSPKMAAFHAAPQTIRVVFGGNGSGKTEAGAYETVKFILTHPHSTVWACGISFGAIEEYVWPKLQKYLPPSLLHHAHIAWVSVAKQVPGVIRFPSLDVDLRFKSYDQGRLKFQGSAVDFAWLDEEPPLGIYNEIVARTSRKRGRIILTMTPLLGLTWAYNQIECAQDDRLIWKTRIATGENSFLPPETVETMRQLYGVDEATRRIAGEFLQPEGACWKEWRVERNVIPRPIIPPDLPLHMGVDFGFADPTAAVWAAEINGRVVVMDDYQVKGKLIEDHLAAWRARYPMNQVTTIYADPEDAAGRVALKRALPHCVIKPANNAVREGLDTVNRALKSQQLQVSASCKGVIYAASMYAFKPNSDAPAHEESHLPDALRYVIMGMLRPPRQHVWQPSGVTRTFQR